MLLQAWSLLWHYLKGPSPERCPWRGWLVSPAVARRGSRYVPGAQCGMEVLLFRKGLILRGSSPWWLCQKAGGKETFSREI